MELKRMPIALARWLRYRLHCFRVSSWGNTPCRPWVQARTALVEVAQKASQHCGEIQKDAEDLTEAWETRCLAEGIVWAGVSLGVDLFVCCNDQLSRQVPSCPYAQVQRTPVPSPRMMWMQSQELCVAGVVYLGMITTVVLV